MPPKLAARGAIHIRGRELSANWNEADMSSYFGIGLLLAEAVEKLLNRLAQKRRCFSFVEAGLQ